MSNSTLTVSFSPSDGGTLSIPSDSEWLRLELVYAEEDVIAAADAAEVIDKLYDIEPCIEEDGAIEEPEPPTEEILKAVAKEVLWDLAKCDQLLSGTYTRQVLVVRSHLNIPYRLRLSIGYISGTRMVITRKEEAYTVENASYYTLPFPVPPREYFPDQERVLAASWLGAVITEDQGRIDPPVIRRNGNTLFWGFDVTGTIKVHWDTIYDEVSVTIPGTPSVTGRSYGISHHSTLLAFYNNTVTTEQIEPPKEQLDQDFSFLSSICNWEDDLNVAPPSDGGEEEEEEEDEEEPTDYYPNGCTNRVPILKDPEHFEETCCHPPNIYFVLNDCTQVRIRKQPVGLSQEVMDDIRDAANSGGAWGGWNSGGFLYDIKGIEFVGHGPRPGDRNGCGWDIYDLYIPNRNCCDPSLITEPYFPEEINPSVQADFTSVILRLSGGVPPFTWRVSEGELYFLRNGQEVSVIESESRLMYVYSKNVCGPLSVEITDECNQTAEHRWRAATGGWVWKEQRAWYDGSGTGSSDDSCIYNDPDDGPIIPDPNMTGTSGYEVSESGTSWTAWEINGYWRFTEVGGTHRRVRRDGPVPHSNEMDDWCATPRRPAPLNCYPPCISMPPGLEFEDCTTWDCYADCSICDDDSVMKSDRYGVVICGTAIYGIGVNIANRKWEKWEC